MNAPDLITYNPGYKVTYEGADPSRGYVYTRTDLSQASVAAALEAAADRADVIANGHRDNECSDIAAGAQQVADNIRAMITQRDHDALAAHVAAEVAKDAAWLLIDTAPKTDADFDEIYGSASLHSKSVIIGRADILVENGCIPGVSCEAYWREGQWQRIVHPDVRPILGDWVAITDPTHWKPHLALPIAQIGAKP